MITFFKNNIINSNLYSIRKYKKGDIIFNEGDICSFVGFVEKGNISIVTSTTNENEYEINNIEDNGFFGVFAIFSSNPIFLGTGIALKSTSIYIFNKNNLLKALDNKDFLLKYLEITSQSTLKIQNKVKILSQGSIRQKILFLLYNNYHITNNKEYYFDSKLSLANYLNIPRPSLSRVLISLKEEKIINYDRYKITLL